MKIWRIANPWDYQYARANESTGTLRPMAFMEWIRPLILEWEPDSDVVGDFVWPGSSPYTIVTQQVNDTLRGAGIDGFELKPIEMRENSDPKVRRSKKPRVKLPYTGPQLWELWVTAWAHLDRERSTLEEDSRSDGRTYLKPVGVQRVESHWNPRLKELVRTNIPRTEGQGLFVPPIRGIFRVEEIQGLILCTDDVKQLIEKHEFTNVSFLEMGDVLEA